MPGSARLEKEGIGETDEPRERLVLSADGSFVHLTSGEWREVKSVAVGEFETERSQGRGGSSQGTESKLLHTQLSCPGI